MIKFAPITLLIFLTALCSGQSIQHIVVMIKENRSTAELFGTKAGTLNFCQGGNSPLRPINNQSITCSTQWAPTSGGSWCMPTLCTTPTGPECSAGDKCPQITTGRCKSSSPCPSDGSYIALVEEDPNALTSDVSHTQQYFLSQLYNVFRGGTNQTGKNAVMEWNPDWAGPQGGLSYLAESDIPYYWRLANTYALADQHYSRIGGPSEPAHLILFAGQPVGGGWSDNGSNGTDSTRSGSASDPGSNSIFLSSWSCGAKHSYSTGSTSYPYTYAGFVPSTLSNGTQVFGGTNTSNPTLSCACACATGKKCAPIASCTDTVNGGTCSTANTIGGTSSSAVLTGAPCLAVTTIADQAETAGVSWKYYSQNTSPGWLAAAYSEQIYFNSTRWNAHIFPDTQLDTDVANCTGMCSNNHATACTVDSQCGSGQTCTDSDGTPVGSAACALPQVVYSSPTAAADSDHPGLGKMATGMTWTQNRLTPFFRLTNTACPGAAPCPTHVYNSTIILLTWDDWGGHYDPFPPPVVDQVPTDGFRVPVIAISPYAKNAVIHTQYDFLSILKCIENRFSIPSINSADSAATDICAGTGTLASNADGMINTSQTPIPPLGSSVVQSTSNSSLK